MSKKVVIGVSVIILICFMSVYIFSFLGMLVHAEDVNSQLNDLENKKEELQQQIDDVREEKESKIADAAAVEEKVSDLQEDIDVIQGEIDECQNQIEVKIEELAEAEQKADDQYEAMKLRLRAMYEEDTTSYVTLLFSGESLTDMLSYAEIIKQLVSYDNTMHDNLVATEQQIADAKTELEEQKQLSEEKKGELDEKQAAYEEQKSQLDQAIAELSDEEAQALQEYQEAEAAEKSLKAQIAAAEAAAASRQQGSGGDNASQGQAVTYSGEGFIYPCTGYTSISSDYGYRVHPTLHVYKLHTGIDFPVPSGTPVHASSGGTVIQAGWNNAYGNVVVISHGGGISTLYAHNTSLLVSVGQTVTQGQTIAYSGNTGYSTGPHCHFEVLKNGSAVDPKAYL